MAIVVHHAVLIIVAGGAARPLSHIGGLVGQEKVELALVLLIHLRYLLQAVHKLRQVPA